MYETEKIAYDLISVTINESNTCIDCFNGNIYDTQGFKGTGVAKSVWQRDIDASVRMDTFPINWETSVYKKIRLTAKQLQEQARVYILQSESLVEASSKSRNSYLID